MLLRVVVVAVLLGSLIGGVLAIEGRKLLDPQRESPVVRVKPTRPHAVAMHGPRASCTAAPVDAAEAVSARVAAPTSSATAAGGAIERVDGLSDAEWCLAHVPASP